VVIEQLHRQVHELVTEMYQFDGRGCNPEALAKLDELHSLCEALHEQFKELVQDFRQRARRARADSDHLTGPDVIGKILAAK